MLELILMILGITIPNQELNFTEVKEVPVEQCANLIHIPDADLSGCDINKTNRYIMNIKKRTY